ncbi:cytidine/deoxycytidylate deaminase family protein [Halocatena halophila]|uniref:cytidine deaminase n=1 Tax=Halocatena halophila TaxID=2814576 RepID=UPI002ED55F31
MDAKTLTDRDERLLDRARTTCKGAYDPNFFDGAHIVAAAIRTAAGDSYDGVSLPANIGRVSQCAEPSAIGTAIADGNAHDDLECAVAVAFDSDVPAVVPPCGACRELLMDYDIDVIVPLEGVPHRVSPATLLPTRTW